MLEPEGIQAFLRELRRALDGPDAGELPFSLLSFFEPGPESLLIWVVARILPVSCQGWVAKWEGTTLVKKREQADAEQGWQQSSALRRRVYAQTIQPRLMLLDRKYTIGPVQDPHFAVLELNHVFGDPPDPHNEEDLEGWCYTGEFKGDF